jgi:DNA-binding beta-propeller fold protein YncE
MLDRVRRPALLGAAALCLLLFPSSALGLDFLLKWGEHGESRGEFGFAEGIATDPRGNVYVADWANHRIQKFTPEGKFITEWGSHGGANRQFSYPEGIATDTRGNVYVADTGNNRIQKFGPHGDFITKWGGFGSGDGEFDSPVDIATDADGNVYVADHSWVPADAHQWIQKFTPRGDFITKWGGWGSGEGEFGGLTGVAADADGNVYATEVIHERVQKFTSDGTFLTMWGTAGSGDGEFATTPDVATDPQGNVYVLDGGYNGRVQQFTSHGDFLTKWGTSGYGDGQLAGPTSIAADRHGNVYVLDDSGNRVQKFGGFSLGSVRRNKKAGTAVLAATVPRPGEVKLARTRKVTAVEKRASSHGVVRVPVRSRGKATRTLESEGRVKVRARVTYMETGGGSSTRSKLLVLRKRG